MVLSSEVLSIEKQLSVGNRFCSHPCKYYTKEKYNSDGKQIGTPYDKPNESFLKCSRVPQHCGAEFAIIQRRK